MPERYRPRRDTFSLSDAHGCGQMFRVRCRLCHTNRLYFPDDLGRLLGNIDCELVERRMRCETCGEGEYIDARGVFLTAQERVGKHARRLVEVRLKKVPIWRDEAL